MSDDFIRQMTEQVTPGTTAVVLLTNGGDEQAVEAELHRVEGAPLIYSNLPPVRSPSQRVRG